MMFVAANNPKLSSRHKTYYTLVFALFAVACLAFSPFYSSFFLWGDSGSVSLSTREQEGGTKNTSFSDDIPEDVNSSSPVDENTIAFDLEKQHTENATKIDVGLSVKLRNETALAEVRISCKTRRRKSQVSIKKFWANEDCRLPMNKVVFFHVGKAGGGTIKLELRDEDRFDVLISHPSPKSELVSRLQTGPATTLIFNIRDPVDRFVSAFRWESQFHCHPGDNRTASQSGIMIAAKPNLLCSEKGKNAEVFMRETYLSNPNNLAEALCEESPNREEAVSHFDKISHMKKTLVRWLDFLIDPQSINNITSEGIQNLLVVPLEAQNETSTQYFQQYIELLTFELLRIKFGEEIAEYMVDLKPKSDSTESDEHQKDMKHSTKVIGKSSSLTPLGECCVARHHEADYQLIQTMLPDNKKVKLLEPLKDAHPLILKGCEWGGAEYQELCQSDLRSILLRRVHYLDRSQGTCFELFQK